MSFEIVWKKVFVIQKNILPFCYTASSVPGFSILEHGFTGHEHIRQFDLINMNARLYDPQIARFLSPDIEISNPENPQNYDRYAYCLNNPMKYTDPTGNNPAIVFAIGFAIMNAGNAYIKGGTSAAITSLYVSAATFGVNAGIGAGVNSLITDSFLRFAVSTVVSDITSQLLFTGKYSGLSTISSLVIGAAKMGIVEALSTTPAVANEANQNQQKNGVAEIPECMAPRKSGQPIIAKVTQYDKIKLGKSKIKPLSKYNESMWEHVNQTEIQVKIKIQDDLYTEVGVVQTVNTNGTEKLDQVSGIDVMKPFYDTDCQKSEAITMGVDGIFYDAPASSPYDTYFGYRMNESNWNWTATTTFCGKLTSGEWRPLMTFTWGYSTDSGKNMTITPISTTSPTSTFHNIQLNTLNGGR